MNDPGPDDPRVGPPPAAADDGIDWLDPEDEGVGPAVVTTVDCWRCGKEVAAALPLCPHCRARLASEPAGPRPADPESGDVEAATARLLYLYLVYLATLVVYRMAMGLPLIRKAPPTDEEIRAEFLMELVVEAVGAGLVLVGFVWLRRPSPFPAAGLRRRFFSWLAAVPTFVLLLTANFAYFRLLKNYLGLPDLKLDFSDHPELIPWAVVCYCAQPALVEELFFRYLAIGHLRPVVGTHGAIWIAAVMFGMAHLFNPRGIPYLILAGAVFGYVRVYGRSLAIPILMHFAHNALVIWSEPWL